ncbi:hypothetical protein H2200_009825 [Cladophialophora chaetospira]|uniref:Uncharacterized protein n=1 Tax=Cladophialophora chaetospira TaxID=386627 RepID=A0AA39CF53_9EURO|nr:hypothetical protein H2200_009825 [Cladophialophora chaetospira]
MRQKIMLKIPRRPYFGPKEKRLLYDAIGVAHREFTTVQRAIKTIRQYIEDANHGSKPTEAELQSQLNEMTRSCGLGKGNKSGLFKNWQKHKHKFISSPGPEESTSSEAGVDELPNTGLNVAWDEERGDGIDTDDERQQEEEAEEHRGQADTNKIPRVTQPTTREDSVHQTECSQRPVDLQDTLSPPQDKNKLSVKPDVVEFTIKLLQAVEGAGSASLCSLDPEDDIKITIDRSLQKIRQAIPSLLQVNNVARLSFSEATSQAAQLAKVLFEDQAWNDRAVDEINVLIGAHVDSVRVVLQAFAAAAIYLWVLVDIEKNFNFDPNRPMTDQVALEALKQAQNTTFDSNRKSYPELDATMSAEDGGIFDKLRRVPSEHPHLFKDFDIIREVCHLEGIAKHLPMLADRFQQQLLDALRSLCQSTDRLHWSSSKESSSTSRLESQQRWRKQVVEAFLEVLELKIKMRKARLLYHFTFPTVRSSFKRESMESVHSRDVVTPEDAKVDLCLRPSVWFKRRQNQKDTFKVIIPALVSIDGFAADVEFS